MVYELVLTLMCAMVVGFIAHTIAAFKKTVPAREPVRAPLHKKKSLSRRLH